MRNKRRVRGDPDLSEPDQSRYIVHGGHKRVVAENGRPRLTVAASCYAPEQYRIGYIIPGSQVSLQLILRHVQNEYFQLGRCFRPAYQEEESAPRGLKLPKAPVVEYRPHQ